MSSFIRFFFTIIHSEIKDILFKSNNFTLNKEQFLTNFKHLLHENDLPLLVNYFNNYFTYLILNYNRISKILYFFKFLIQQTTFPKSYYKEEDEMNIDENNLIFNLIQTEWFKKRRSKKEIIKNLYLNLTETGFLNVKEWFYKFNNKETNSIHFFFNNFLKQFFPLNFNNFYTTTINDTLLFTLKYDNEKEEDLNNFLINIINSSFNLNINILLTQNNLQINNNTTNNSTDNSIINNNTENENLINFIKQNDLAINELYNLLDKSFINNNFFSNSFFFNYLLDCIKYFNIKDSKGHKWSQSTLLFAQDVLQGIGYNLYDNLVRGVIENNMKTSSFHYNLPLPYSSTLDYHFNINNYVF
ncbi:hypothetical protein ABK040_015797 [Willaertia magna]